jgi:hypothetical protein
VALRGALGGGQQLVAELRVCDRRECLAALVDGPALQLEPNANVVTLTRSYWPLWLLVILPAQCSFMQPSVNISLCSP